MNEKTPKRKSALFVYTNESYTGLSGKAKKIEEGFTVAGYELRTLYLNNTKNKYDRITQWLRIQVKYLVLTAGGRNDVIFVRYAYYFFLIYFVSLVLNKKIQIEINSNAQKELLNRRQRLRAKLNALSLRIAMKSASRIHVVSNELKSYYQSQYPKASIVFTPNFVVDEYFREKPQRRGSRKINLVFLGNTAQPWHGILQFIQRIILKQNWFSENCTLHIIGNCSQEIKNLIVLNKLQKTIVFHGFLRGKQKHQIMNQMDIGISGFCLRAIGLRETTGMKIGEYVHCGLGLILGYVDPVIPPDLPFVLSIDLDIDPNCPEKIKQFIDYYRKHQELGHAAHQYARSNLLVDRYIENIIK